jgi:hypothetical protein
MYRNTPQVPSSISCVQSNCWTYPPPLATSWVLLTQFKISFTLTPTTSIYGTVAEPGSHIISLASRHAEWTCTRFLCYIICLKVILKGLNEKKRFLLVVTALCATCFLKLLEVLNFNISSTTAVIAHISNDNSHLQASLKLLCFCLQVQFFGHALISAHIRPMVMGSSYCHVAVAQTGRGWGLNPKNFTDRKHNSFISIF